MTLSALEIGIPGPWLQSGKDGVLNEKEYRWL